MRSSKSRSRSKSNRSRSMGNIVNRVFDSSGPEGKVRGTPQQIIDKYAQLTRDATLGNDRVAAENFQQHAEHYTRMLGEAQREQEARREQQEAQNRERQRERHEQSQAGNNNHGQSGGDNQPRDREQPNDRSPDMARNRGGNGSDQPDLIEDAMETAPQPDLAVTKTDVLDVVSNAAGDTGLVETPESTTKPKPKPRNRPRKPKADLPADGAPDQPEVNGGAAEPDDKPKAKRSYTRKPSKPATDSDAPAADTPVSGGSESGTPEPTE